MKDPKSALYWITNILKNHNIPFQIAGGLAVLAYGGTRELEDIDIDIPDEKFDIIAAEVKPYIIAGPERFKGDSWDLLLMTLNYHGQDIDISGADTTKIFNKTTNQWQRLITDFAKTETKHIFGLDVPVIPREELIAYKSALARDVDVIDVRELTGN